MKTSAGIRDRRAIWGRTLADLDPNNDHKPENNMNGSEDADPNVDSEEGSEVIPPGDNMPRIVDYPIIKQGVATRNKKLVLIILLCFLSYSQSEQTNPFQVLNGHFLFANHVPKRAVESFYQMVFVVLNETICRGFQVNMRAILSRLKERAQTQRFFISYNNINFYEKVKDQCLYNKAHIVNYIAGYVCFINAADESPLPYLNDNQL